ncbi:MAG: response regulator [Hydrococcus sp. C42_A2020_068]|uniref:response regulator n=1 Tax=Pleurocapsa sp. PCC 7327 TaxID=118163 RepID=UPI00029FCE41|nr:response regulator [Pleurocapsa sp. PCC 7327]AFY77887.1 response regulator containing a CheY-like receiver domain and an HD-GYP domain [Pleurocapsa sp. PCC 7327]MBF2019278.1 response regulator [Hydrococcus sp. C42_A2020_068]
MDLNGFVDRFEASVEKTPLVLAVDGDEDNLLLVKYVVEQFNCTLLRATSSREALSLARENPPDLIVLEMVLPKLDGFELVRLLKNNGLTARIPLIAVTQLALPREREKILNVGCDAYLSKPYLFEDLEAILSRYLDRLPAMAVAAEAEERMCLLPE